MCFTVQLSRSLSCDSHIRLSHLFWLVKNFFFIFLKISFFKIFQFFSTALIDYHKPFCLSRTFFKFFNLKTVSGERGIWTLARREPSTPLAGAPLQPLEYFSIAWIILNHSIFCSAWAICIIPLFMKICQLLFWKFFRFFFSTPFWNLLPFDLD